MRLLTLALSLLLFGQVLLHAQENNIKLRDVWASGKFYPKRFSNVQHMKDGQHYTRMERLAGPDQQALVKYSYQKADPVDTLLKTGELSIEEGINDYQFSDDERYLLFKTQEKSIYRYSTKGVFYVYDRSEASLVPVHNGAHIMYATFSPDGEKVAYVHKNDLYIQANNSGDQKRVTDDGQMNKILNGRSDWVYEEEFKLVKAFKWSPNGEKLAFYRFDESRVNEYSLNKYVDSNYPKKYQYKYPKAGEQNSLLSIHIYDINSEKAIEVATGNKKDIYLPRMKWTKDPERLAFQRMNRHQDHLQLYFANAENGKSRKVYEEERDTYINIDKDLTFLEGNRFIWSSDKDGYQHLYLIDANGEELSQITEGKWPVTEFIGYDPANEQVYYQSAEVSPMERHVYRIGLDGNNKKTMANGAGTYEAEFSEDYSYYIQTHTAANKPQSVSIHQKDGTKIREPVTNETLRKQMKEYVFKQKSFFQFETKDGTSLNGWMIKPKGFNESEEYPVFMTCYGGPGAQTVTHDWGSLNYIYHQYLAQQGYLVVSVDNRGTGGRGADFQKQTYKNLGELESTDQIEAARYLGEKEYVDENRIGIFGWSYGGYLSLMSLAKGSDVFKTAVSVAPVTDWRFYDNIYTERFMQRPSDNEKGYRKSSLLNKVDKFEDHFLLVHGMYDDNVHPQHSMELIKRLVQRNKSFDTEFYANKTHSIAGGLTRYHLFQRISKYLDNYLKKPQEDELLQDQ